MQTAWISRFVSDLLWSMQAIEEALSGVGIEIASPRGDDDPSPGIVFFDEISDSLIGFLQEASQGGVKRVLSVAMDKRNLAGEGAWSLLAAGASDVTTWESGITPAQIAARLERWAAVDAVMHSNLVAKNLIGQSQSWLCALRRSIEIARFTQAPLLVEGESGTGKELIAQLVHALDPRPAKKELVVVDCTTIVPELSGSEFFGHEKGAFTGATGPRDGAFALADGGTLFLDEIGELPLPLQAQLLRVVQERTYKRVGGNTWYKTCFRLVCATNRNLLAEVERGTFRRDLYYRIASTYCYLPPLRERPDDILPLARHFMEILRPGSRPPELDAHVRDFLRQRTYPGNVRDLRQLVTRIFYRHVGAGPITVGDLPDEERPRPGTTGSDWRVGQFEDAVRRAVTMGAGLKDIGRAAEDLAVRLVVDDEAGNLQKAASRLGVTDRALQMRRACRKQLD